LRGKDAGEVALCNLRLADSGTMRSFATMPLARELARLGPAARPFVPGLEGAMNTTFPGFVTMELIQKAQVARALWSINGSAQAALDLLAASRHPAGDRAPAGRGAQPMSSDFREVVLQLCDIPEVARAAKPMLESMAAGDDQDLANYQSNVLARIERALRNGTNGPVPAVAR
jgi:hypothetical protein